MDLQFLFSFFVFGLLFLFLVQHHQQRRLPPCPQPCLPIIGHLYLLGPLVHQTLHRLSLRCGPFFSLRFGSVPCIVACTPHHAKRLLQANELSFIHRIETAAVKRLTYESSLAFAPYGAYWRFIRKLSMNELLGTRAMNHFQKLRAQEYDSLLKLLARRAEAGEAINMTEELLKLTNNVISRMILGEAVEAREVVRGVTKIFGEFNVSDFIWLFKKFDFQGFGKRIEDLFHSFDTLVERVISKRLEMRKKEKGEDDESTTKLKDFLDILLDCVEDESSELKINLVHVKALIMDFFTAGTDTTAAATEWALVELMNNPMIMQKARDEIYSVVAMQEVPALLGAIIQCFDFKVLPSSAETDHVPTALLDVDERPGLTAPRAHDLVIFPSARPNHSQLKILH
ncbi:hypothetical protein L6164_036561 [Bauhinia variegata]|uniref:Uncharacterized protein n=1 Tax=Bauhinia variegata TaxID=167791 RepID=A0ACB9KHK8_BAUVA|nr:hypothetical protein L6164_036561 [Bauhinia variegata]